MPHVTAHLGAHAGEALWQAFVGRLSEPDHGPALWIAPSAYAAAAIRRRIARDGRVAVLSPGVFASQQLAGHVLSLSGSPSECRPLDAVMKQRLIGQIVARRRTSNRLEHYGRLGRDASLINLLTREIDNANARGATPQRLLAQAKAAATPRLQEFAELFAEYRAATESAGLFDAAGRWRKAGELLRQGRQSWRWVAIASCEALSAAERGFLAAVAANADQVTVALADDERAAEVEWLQDSIGAVQFERGPRVDNGKDDLAFVEQYLFRDTLEAPAPPDDADASPPAIAVLRGPSVQGEVELIAKRVKRHLLGGDPAEELVVTAPSVPAIAQRLVEAFERVGVPLAVGGEQRLGDTPVARGLVGLLSLLLDDWAHADVLRVLTSPALRVFDELEGDDPRGAWRDLKQGGLAGPRAAAELAIRRLLLPHGRQELVDQLRRELAFATRRAEDASRDPGRDVLASRCALAVVERLGGALDALPRRATPLDWCDALRALLNRLGYAAPSGDGAETAQLDLAGLDAMEAAFASLERLARWRGEASPRLTISEVADLLADWLVRVPIEATPDDQGRVRFLTFDAAVAERPRRLFVVGLVEGALPRPTPAGDPFVSTSRELRDEHLHREMTRFRQLVTAAKKSVVLSYPSLDDAAQPLNPSSFVAEVERLFLPRSIELEGSVSSGPLCPADMRAGAVAAMNDGSGDELARLAAEPATTVAAPAVFDGLYATLERSTGDLFGANEGVLAGSAARGEFADRYGPKHHWSPSQLELYAECPFKFFMRQSLGVEPLDALTLDIDYRRRGSLLHDAMARFYTSLDGDVERLADEEFLDRFGAAVDEAAEAIGVAPHERPLMRVEAMQAVAWGPLYRDQVQAYAGQPGGVDRPMAPTYFEARFGPPRGAESTDAGLSTDEPFRFSLGDEELLLTGRIDRIDVGEVGGQPVFNIVDYKTAATVKPSLDAARSGRQLQLYLYALAAERLLLKEQGAAAWRLGYWAVRDDGFKPPKENRRELTASELSDDGELLPTDAWRSLEAEVVERLKEIVAGIRGASFPMLNEDKDCFGRCEFAGVCRVGQARGVGKVIGDAAGSQGAAP